MLFQWKMAYWQFWNLLLSLFFSPLQRNSLLFYGNSVTRDKQQCSVFGFLLQVSQLEYNKQFRKNISL